MQAPIVLLATFSLMPLLVKSNDEGKEVVVMGQKEDLSSHSSTISDGISILGDNVEKTTTIPQRIPNKLGKLQYQDGSKMLGHDLNRKHQRNRKVSGSKLDGHLKINGGSEGIDQVKLNQRVDFVPHEAYNWTEGGDIVGNATMGNATNCASKGGPKLEFHWEPAIVDPQGSVTIHIDMVLPDSFDHGAVEVGAAVKQQSQAPSFITMAMPIYCKEDIQSQVPGLICPLQKSMPVKHTFTVSSLTMLPVGAFHFSVRVKNEQDREIVCLEMDVELRPKAG